IQPPAPRPDSPDALRAAWARYAAEQEAAYGHNAELPCQEHLANDHRAADALSADVENGAAGQLCASSLEHLPTVAPASLDLEQLWNAVLAAVRTQISRQEFNRSFRGAILRSIEDGIATITVAGVAFKESLENRYLGLLRDLIGSHLGFPIQVRV